MFTKEIYQSTISLVILYSEFSHKAHKFALDGHIFTIFKLISYLGEILIMLKNPSHKD